MLVNVVTEWQDRGIRTQVLSHWHGLGPGPFEQVK